MINLFVALVNLYCESKSHAKAKKALYIKHRKKVYLLVKDTKNV